MTEIPDGGQKMAAISLSEERAKELDDQAVSARMDELAGELKAQLRDIENSPQVENELPRIVPGISQRRGPRDTRELAIKKEDNPEQALNKRIALLRTKLNSLEGKGDWDKIMTALETVSLDDSAKEKISDAMIKMQNDRPIVEALIAGLKLEDKIKFIDHLIAIMEGGALSTAELTDTNPAIRASGEKGEINTDWDVSPVTIRRDVLRKAREQGGELGSPAPSQTDEKKAAQLSDILERMKVKQQPQNETPAPTPIDRFKTPQPRPHSVSDLARKPELSNAKKIKAFFKLVASEHVELGAFGIGVSPGKESGDIGELGIIPETGAVKFKVVEVDQEDVLKAVAEGEIKTIIGIIGVTKIWNLSLPEIVQGLFERGLITLSQLIVEKAGLTEEQMSQAGLELESCLKEFELIEKAQVLG